MAFKKKTVVCTFTAAAQELDFGAAVARVFKFHLLSSVDTSVSASVVDGDSKTISTIASADYTTETTYYIEPVEATQFDSAGEVTTADGSTGQGVIATGPLTITAAGHDAGETLTVEVFYEV